MKKTLSSNNSDIEFTSHCFPSILGVMAPDHSGEDTCNLFQPMFGCDSDNPSDASEKGSESGMHLADLVEEARKKGLERGVASGRQEACRLSQDALKPEFKAFLDVLESMAVYHQLVSETAADETLKLALLMAEMILPDPLSMPPHNLDNLSDDLMKGIADAYRLKLEIHPDALIDLKQAMDCSQVCWPEQQAVSIHGESTLADDGVNVRFISSGELDLANLISKG